MNAPVALTWRAALVVLGAAFAALVLLFWESVSLMVETWYVSATFNHGFAILPICAWLIWDRKDALRTYVPQPCFRAVLPVLACVAVWIVGEAAGVNSVRQFAFVGMAVSTVLAVLGWPLTRAMMFPLGYLFFAVPFGDFLIPSLQDLTAVMVVEGLRWVDVPVFMDGVFLSIPSGNFEVAEACSGVRFLIATLALGALFANLCFRTWWRRLIIILLAIVVPVIANGIRAFGIVYIAHITDHRVAAGVDHLIYGWMFFAVVTVLLLAIGMSIEELIGPIPAP